MSAREPERWMDIPGYEDYYQVSTEGRVRGLARIDARGNHRTGRILRQAIGSNGRRYVTLCKKGVMHTTSVSVFVACAYNLPNPRNCEFVIHRNGDNADFHPENLQWVTLPEQRMHDGRKVCPYYGVSRVTHGPGTGILRWIAAVRVDGQRREFGYFATAVEAAYAYDCAVKRLGLQSPLNGVRKPKPYVPKIESLPGEVWRPFPNAEMTHMISNKGRVRTLAYRSTRGYRVSPKLRKITVDVHGCRTILIKGRRYGISTVLSQVFPASTQGASA